MRMLGLHYLAVRFDLAASNLDARLLRLLERALKFLARVGIAGSPGPFLTR
jgi:hypothetical protein